MKLNFKNIVLFIIFTTLIFTGYSYNQEGLELVKTTLLNPLFNLILILLISAITIFYKIAYNQFNINNILDIQKFKTTISDIISLLTEPATFICSFAILKGLFLDYYFSYKYFELFKTHEKTFLLMASFYFLINSIIEVKNYCVELFINKAEEVSNVSS